MTDQNDLRAAAILAAQESANMGNAETGLLYAQWAEAMHRLADREDAADFTEPAQPIPGPPTLVLSLHEARILARVTDAYLDEHTYDQRVKDLLDRAERVLS